jgi:hypothetical protein
VKCPFANSLTPLFHSLAGEEITHRPLRTARVFPTTPHSRVAVSYFLATLVSFLSLPLQLLAYSSCPSTQPLPLLFSTAARTHQFFNSLSHLLPPLACLAMGLYRYVDPSFGRDDIRAHPSFDGDAPNIGARQRRLKAVGAVAAEIATSHRIENRSQVMDRRRGIPYYPGEHARIKPRHKFQYPSRFDLSNRPTIRMSYCDLTEKWFQRYMQQLDLETYQSLCNMSNQVWFNVCLGNNLTNVPSVQQCSCCPRATLQGHLPIRILGPGVLPISRRRHSIVRPP